jgi:hypothetical protein
MGSRKQENPDLQEERKKCTFNILELTFLLDGGREKTKERKLIGKHHQNLLMLGFTGKGVVNPFP